MADPMRTVSPYSEHRSGADSASAGNAAPGDHSPMNRRRFMASAGATVAAATLATTGQARAADAAAARPDIAAFYFPQWHADPVNESWFGSGWTEWEVLKVATPRFPGQQQPKVPTWGYLDESQPSVMAKKIDAAANHGLDAFIFDWYWYPQGPDTYGPFLNRCLEDGFLQAPNVGRLKFALMWANQDWWDLYPIRRTDPRLNVTPQSQYYTLTSNGVPWVGVQPPASFDQLTSYVVENYLAHPSYWRVAGGAFFSIYQPEEFVSIFGGDLTAARAALDSFRAKARAAGAGELHLNLISVESTPGDPTSIARRNTLIDSLGIDSSTTYVWIHHSPLPTFPETPYTEVRADAVNVWRQFRDSLHGPYFPNVTMGWDSSPRTAQSDIYDNLGYPYLPIMSGNTPQEFQTALSLAQQFAASGPIPSVITINAWNEWTEGSHLEPGHQYSLAYLEAIKNVFGVR